MCHIVCLFNSGHISVYILDSVFSLIVLKVILVLPTGLIYVQVFRDKIHVTEKVPGFTISQWWSFACRTMLIYSDGSSMHCSCLGIFYADLSYWWFCWLFSKPKHDYSLLSLLWFVLPNIKLDLEQLFKIKGFSPITSSGSTDYINIKHHKHKLFTYICFLHRSVCYYGDSYLMSLTFQLGNLIRPGSIQTA